LAGNCKKINVVALIFSVFPIDRTLIMVQNEKAKYRDMALGMPCCGVNFKEWRWFFVWFWTVNRYFKKES
jgi:hypothetical protein